MLHISEKNMNPGCFNWQYEYYFLEQTCIAAYFSSSYVVCRQKYEADTFVKKNSVNQILEICNAGHNKKCCSLSVQSIMKTTCYSFTIILEPILLVQNFHYVAVVQNEFHTYIRLRCTLINVC